MNVPRESLDEVERLDDSATSARSSETSSNDDTGGVIRVFLSYSHRNQTVAGRMKQPLEEYGIKVFLADQDIHLSADWLDTLSKELDRCDVFIPILTQDYKTSDWADQEAGYAVALKKVIIPILFHIDKPHGFLSRTQALRRKSTNDYENAREIADAIWKRAELSERLLDGLIRMLGESQTVREAEDRIRRLLLFKGYSGGQLTTISRHVVENKNIRECRSVAEDLKSILKAQVDSIEPDIFQKAIRTLSIEVADAK
jgi:hypothetical protein